MSTDLKRKPQTQPATRISLRVLGVLIIILVVGCRASQNQEAPLAPPADFEPIAEEVDLSARSHDGETLGQFTLAETADVGVFFSVQEIDIPYFDLSLFGPDDESWVILHSEDYRTDAEGGGLWERSLPPGTYQLVLTADQSPGILSVHWGYR